MSSLRLLRHLKSNIHMSVSSLSDVNFEYIRKLSNLEEQSSDVFRANYLGKGTSVTKNVYGGLLFAQSIVAAEKSVEEKFIPHAIHSLFILNVTPDKPVDYKVQRIRDGRSYCTRLVLAEQDGEIVYTSQMSLGIKEKPAIQHQMTMPKVPQPEELKSYTAAAKEYLNQHNDGTIQLDPFVIKLMQRHISDESESVFEFRPVDPKKYMGIEPFHPQPVNFWLKTVVPIPEQGRIHRFLAAYITDATLAGVANRPHFSHGYRPSMVVSLDHIVRFHEVDFRADEWLLYENWSTVAQNGRAFSEGRLWSRDGRLILSASQESLNRTRGEASRL